MTRTLTPPSVDHEGSSKPWTMYSVALQYDQLVGARRALFSQMFVVSGTNPLTDDEAARRARHDVTYAWDVKQYGPMANWKLVQTAVSRGVKQ